MKYGMWLATEDIFKHLANLPKAIMKIVIYAFVGKIEIDKDRIIGYVRHKRLS